LLKKAEKVRIAMNFRISSPKVQNGLMENTDEQEANQNKKSKKLKTQITKIDFDHN